MLTILEPRVAAEGISKAQILPKKDRLRNTTIKSTRSNLEKEIVISVV